MTTRSMKVDDALDDFRRREIALDGVAKQVSFIRFSGHLQFLVTRVIVSLLEPNTRAEVRKHDATWDERHWQNAPQEPHFTGADADAQYFCRSENI